MSGTALLAQQPPFAPAAEAAHVHVPAAPPARRGLLQRQCACGGAPGAGGECEECQTKRLTVQRRAAAGGSRLASAPPLVAEVLRSPGQPLDAATLAFMEPRFGHGFGRVRVHADARAAESARAVDALAYAAGSHVVFAAGQYAPQTGNGRRLLAHELAHTLQQGDGEPSSPLVVGETDELESAANRAAEAVTGGTVDRYGLGASPSPLSGTIQRQPADPSSGYQLPSGPESPPRLFTVSLAALGNLDIDDFDSNKADLTDTHKTLLDMDAIVLRTLFESDPGATLEVTGHTDARGTEAYNLTLGLERAAAAKRELVTAGVPAAQITVRSAGKSRLLVETQASEPKNRRVEVRFKPSPASATSGWRRTAPQPWQPNLWPHLEPGKGLAFPPPILAPPSGMPTYPPLRTEPPRPLPEVMIPQREWLEHALENDPLIGSLPPGMRKQAIGALKDADEKIADKIVDGLPLEPKYKEAVRALIKALLQTAKGRKWTPPTPPLHEMPPSAAPPFPNAPGVFNLPPLRF